MPLQETPFRISGTCAPRKFLIVYFPTGVAFLCFACLVLSRDAEARQRRWLWIPSALRGAWHEREMETRIILIRYPVEMMERANEELETDLVWLLGGGGGGELYREVM